MKGRTLRPPRAAGVLSVAVALMAGTPAARRAGAETSVTSLLTIDQHLVRADFGGEVVVAEQSWDHASGLQHVRFEVVDSWFTRWNLGRQLVVTTAARGPAFAPKGRYVVFVSGGPWEDSPFTFRGESVFRVAEDGRVSCRSENPLFGVLNDGFLCTAQDVVQGKPISIGQMRAQVVRARALAALRLPELESALSAEPPSLELAPSAAAARAQEVRR